MGVPRTMDEIQQVSNVKKKQLARDYRAMVFNLELNVPPVNYFQYLEKISQQPAIRREDNQKCNYINAKYIKHGNFGWQRSDGTHRRLYFMSFRKCTVKQ